jgi:hypothetical protein
LIIIDELSTIPKTDADDAVEPSDGKEDTVAIADKSIKLNLS